VIEFNNVSKHYVGRAALDKVSLAIGCGEFFVLVGRSGSGWGFCGRLPPNRKCC
jgi:ABC transporter, ATP-binding protein